MEKIIRIDGKDVPFKSTGATLRRYKMQFGRDLLKDIIAMKPKKGVDLTQLSEDDVAGWVAENIDTSVFEDIAWVFAKTANKDLEPVLEWLDTFESFPLWEVFTQVQELLMQTLDQGKK